MGVVKYLCEVGGKELMVMTDKVSACGLIYGTNADIQVAYVHTYVHA